MLTSTNPVLLPRSVRKGIILRGCLAGMPKVGARKCERLPAALPDPGTNAVNPFSRATIVNKKIHGKTTCVHKIAQFANNTRIHW